MIMTISELRELITTTESDDLLKARLAGLEYMIRGYTNNRFQDIGRRCRADIAGGMICSAAIPFSVGDTVQITQSKLNNGLYKVNGVADDYFSVDGTVAQESDVLVTRVVYPPDVKLGVANLIKWDIENRDKAGIASETISRHSVSYVAQDASNNVAGYPRSLLGFLKPYRKARF